jgi:hypothetical protein
MATVAGIIPAMDRLNVALNRQTKQPYHPAIKSVMKLAANKLNRYYSLTDNSTIYRVVMGMFSPQFFAAVIK